ncbi:mitochondrial 54S ribosomal protein mL44 [Aspergillus saccharolyticus JOP 1030-1]|uniref:Large ribosomal subunit protein mL44 n=1 Tax=Aspergillus saccharolyticus JOP 1030-1 TaxID=1450539 RepID=A0A318ZLF6_9EURO|nr:60S ribosomal protein L3 [Aspergillus saccharolyticus JOP 1030-1]PYH48451.1 60S ribosomal protein L3 [Aspergillus saccharolyticus JOP 1030-1]
MKRLQPQRWSSSVLSPQVRAGCRLQRRIQHGLRYQTTTTPFPVTEAEAKQPIQDLVPPPKKRSSRSAISKHSLPSPPVKAARESAKLAALHARLYLPARLPLETLARTLVDESADPNPDFNNESLATLGHDLLTQYTSEYLICTYPRLPMTVIFAAMYAYVGPKTLSAMVKEWGVELAVAPGGEVDPGHLQFKRLDPGVNPNQPLKNPNRPYENEATWRRSISSKIVYDDVFGEPVRASVDPRQQVQSADRYAAGVTPEQACSQFVRAVLGAIYLHAGRPAAKRFFEQHFISRHLNISDLFNFREPARDLSRLCARENFEPPYAKILSETGRLSRHPVFVVGIFSGKDKLGEGSGSSLLEARSRAAVASLKGWYLYSPLNVRLPNSMEEEGAAPWKPVHVDLGEVIV